MPDLNIGILSPPNWEFIKTGVKENISIVKNYYTNHIRPTKSNHILVRLLHSITVPMSLPLDRYYSNVDSINLNMSMVFKFTSSIYKGTVHRGNFMGANNPEIILAIDEPFDFDKVNNDWKNVCAIKPLLHPRSDLNYQLLNGVQHSNEYGLSVFCINITMLMVQYRAYLLNELAINKENPRGATYFIAAYVIPNMLEQQVELSLFNRIYNQVKGINSNNDNRAKHPFALQNYKPFVNTAIDKTIEYLNRSSKSYKNIFSTLPSFYNDNLYHSLLIPDILTTRQVDWVLVASRLKMIDFLISVSDDELLSKNQLQMNQVLKALRINNVNKVFLEMMPEDVFYSNQTYVDTILEVMGRNVI